MNIDEFLKALKWRYNRLKQFLIVRYSSFNKNTIELKCVNISLGKHLSDNIMEALLGGYYEAAELHMVEEKLNKSDVVMEIGTGIGFVSTYCAKRIGSNNIYTFEANPALEPHIRKTFELNSVSPTLEICLLADREGEQSFFVEKDYWSSSMIRRSESAKEVKVPKRLLNDAIRRINPSFLIVDIEGGEHTIFQFIDLHNIKKISIELHTSILGEEKVSAIKSKLGGLGFNIDESVSKVISGFKEELYFERV